MDPGYNLRRFTDRGSLLDGLAASFVISHLLLQPGRRYCLLSYSSRLGSELQTDGCARTFCITRCSYVEFRLHQHGDIDLFLENLLTSRYNAFQIDSTHNELRDPSLLIRLIQVRSGTSYSRILIIVDAELILCHQVLNWYLCKPVKLGYCFIMLSRDFIPARWLKTSGGVISRRHDRVDFLRS